MNYVYPAIFYPEPDGKFSVIFPDLNDLATFGNDLSDAFAMATEACSMYLFNTLRDGELLPKPSSINDIEKDDDNAFVNMVLVDLSEYAKHHSDKAIKKTLSIPTWLNTLCEKKNINYSKVLQEALINKVQEKI